MTRQQQITATSIWGLPRITCAAVLMAIVPAIGFAFTTSHSSPIWFLSSSVRKVLFFVAWFGPLLFVAVRHNSMIIRWWHAAWLGGVYGIAYFVVRAGLRATLTSLRSEEGAGSVLSYLVHPEKVAVPSIILFLLLWGAFRKRA